jgi:RNA polymerase sigma-70 factor (ECF subfamily)
MSFQDRSARPLKLVSANTAVEARRRSDAELVYALRAGEPGAAQAIWDRHSATVHRFLLRALGRPGEEVEDLTQEVFLRVLTRADVIREPAALREFIVSVAVRVLRWELRRRWVRRVVRLSEVGELPEVAVPGADHEARQALARCYAILDRLSTRERLAFVMRYLEDMTMDEVAERLGTSLSTAKRAVGRAAAIVSAQVGQDANLRDYFSRASVDRQDGSDGLDGEEGRDGS